MALLGHGRGPVDPKALFIPRGPRPLNYAPTIALNTADANNFGSDTTPTLEFTGTDPEGDEIRYEVQVATDNLFTTTLAGVDDFYSETNQVGEFLLSSFSGDVQEVGQAFTSTGGSLASAKFHLIGIGSPTGNIVAKLYAATGTLGSTAMPTGTALATSDAVDVTTIGTGSRLLYTFTFSGANQFTLVNGTTYCIVLAYSGGGSGNEISVGGDNTSPTHAGNSTYFQFGSWTAFSGADVCFYVNVATAGSILLDKVSGTDAGFLNTVNGGDTDPFNNGEKVSFTVQAGDALAAATYYWRARAIDPNGGMAWSDWATPRTFIIGTLYTSALSGSISFVGSISKRAAKVLTAAAVSFVGAQSKSTLKALIGSLSFVGAIAKSISRSLSAALSFIGAIAKGLGRAFSAAVSFVGALATNFISGSAGAGAGLLLALQSLVQTGGAAGGTTYTSTLSGSLSFVGAQSKSTGKALSGTISFIGNLAKLISRSLTATVNFVGATARATSRTLTAALSFVGAISKQAKKALVAAALSFAGAVVRKISHSLAGTLSFVGNFVYPWRQTGALSFVGAIAKRTNRSLTGALSFVGASAKAPAKTLSGAISFIGVIAKNTSRTLVGVLSFVGAIVKSTNRLLTGALSFIGALTSLQGHGGNIFAQPLSASLSFVGAIAKNTQRTLTAASLSFVGAISKQANKALAAAALSFAGVFRKSTQKALAAALSFIGNFKYPWRATAALSFVGATAKSARRALSGTLSFAGIFAAIHPTPKALSGALSFQGNLASAFTAGVPSRGAGIGRWFTERLAYKRGIGETADEEALLAILVASDF